MDISVYKLAKALKVSRPRLNDLVLGRRSVSTDTALRLGRHFGTSPEFWLALQTRYQRESIAAVGRLLGQDPSLDEAGADALEAIIRTAYESSRRRTPAD